jgi:hypothetical protein
VSLGAEYTHADYGAVRYGFGAPGAGTTQETPQVGLADDKLAAKVNFHFGPGMGVFH